MRKGCCILLQLDTTHINKMCIDDKIVRELYFRGEQIYSSKQWLAVIANSVSSTMTTVSRPYSSVRISKASSSEMNMYDLSYTVGGYTKYSLSTKGIKIASYNMEKGQFGNILLDEAFELYGHWKDAVKTFFESNSFTITDAKLLSRFRQDDLEEDIQVSPYLAVMNITGSVYKELIYPKESDVVVGRGEDALDRSWDNGLSWTYSAEYKGMIYNKIFDLPDFDIEKVKTWFLSSKIPARINGLAQMRRMETDKSGPSTKCWGSTILLLEVDKI